VIVRAAQFRDTSARVKLTGRGNDVKTSIEIAALELAKHRIRVNVVCSGAIDTEIDDSTKKRDVDRAKEPAEFPAGKIPLTGGKPGTSEQVAQLVLFLASDASSHITGTPVWIDGAESLLQG
jgi:NAD(P)-dependent dehydrogenase (short-subunit alcohol dehydrogenase family)